MSLDGTPGVKSNATSSGPGASGAGVVARRDADRGASPSPSAGSDKQLTEKELRVGFVNNFWNGMVMVMVFCLSSAI